MSPPLFRAPTVVVSSPPLPHPLLPDQPRGKFLVPSSNRARGRAGEEEEEEACDANRTGLLLLRLLLVLDEGADPITAAAAAAAAAVPPDAATAAASSTEPAGLRQVHRESTVAVSTSRRARRPSKPEESITRGSVG